MFKKLFICYLFLSLFSAAQARRQGPPAQREEGFISPAELNVRIEPDVRLLVVMAAVNVAGFDYESANQPLSPARAALRRDLAGLDPQIKKELADYYRSHRREGVDEPSDAARYAALSMFMTPPPAFSVYQTDRSQIPPDLLPLVDFAPLVQKFYVRSGIKELLPKYMPLAETYATAYRRPVGEMLYRVIDYFHARPETTINLRPLVVGGEGADGGKKKQKQNTSAIMRTRTRNVFIIPDPFAALGTSFVRGDVLNQKEDLLARKVGDDYIVVIGPSRTPSLDATRQALIRFVIDPIVERHLKLSLDYKEQITKLVAAVPTAGKQFSASVYLVLRESLAQAAEARMRRTQATQAGRSYSDEDAVYDLSQAYLRGAVLVFHFYDSLAGLEKVGINIDDFFDQMLATAKFEREAARPKEFEAVVASVSAARRSNAPKAGAPGTAASEASPMAGKILLSDDFIRQRRFNEARGILDEILSVQPNNARALYGKAQVVAQSPSAAELDPNADENDKIQAQHDRLEEALSLYRKAIENASKDSELWLIQWGHVLMGRILDFQEFRADAIAEYEKAIALGRVPNGAYNEALEGKQRPYGQK